MLAAYCLSEAKANIEFELNQLRQAGPGLDRGNRATLDTLIVSLEVTGKRVGDIYARTMPQPGFTGGRSSLTPDGRLGQFPV